VVPQLKIAPSPSAEIVLCRYDEAAHPKFRYLFKASTDSRFLNLARDPEEASVAVILENRSAKAITALRYRWVVSDAAGNQRTLARSCDSYMVDVYRAVAEPGSRHLISPSGSVDEALIDHVLAGGGMMGGRCGSEPSLANVVEGNFEIDFVLFVDGEIAGIDGNQFGAELRCRKPAAEFVVKQIRAASAEGRDVTPVLSALSGIPCLGRTRRGQGDPLLHSIQRYARDYLIAMRVQNQGPFDMREAKLRHLENRPTLPRFYRRT
jgi:hypothetical protein